MATRRIQEFLDGNHVPYAMVCHSPAYSAAEVAKSSHIKGNMLAKVVLVMVSDELAMAVVPATRDVDLGLIQSATGFLDARLATEAEFANRFEGCQLGTVPPFGNLFGMDTYIDPQSVAQRQIAFNAGTHHNVIVMDTDDYLRLVQPTVVHIDADPINQRFPALSL
jgi:Ala-tRNA(Pro) deacylase